MICQWSVPALAAVITLAWLSSFAAANVWGVWGEIVTNFLTVKYKINKMATKNGIGYSPLTEKIYLGNQDTKNRIWVGEKKDITNDFLAVSSEYFAENTIRDIVCNTGTSNLFINIKNEPKSIKSVIKNLTKRVEDIKPGYFEDGLSEHQYKIDKIGLAKETLLFDLAKILGGANGRLSIDKYAKVVELVTDLISVVENCNPAAKIKP